VKSTAWEATFVELPGVFVDGLRHVGWTLKDLRGFFTRLVRGMQTRYVLTYYANGVASAGWHSIDVKLPRRRAEIVARRGYWRR
jgi:hypothetical protein